MSRISIGLIKMYCDMVQDKFNKKINKARDADMNLDYRANRLVYEKAGLLKEFIRLTKIRIEEKELSDKLNSINLRNEKREAREKLSEVGKILDEIDRIKNQIKLSSCPEEILTILNNIKE